MIYNMEFTKKAFKEYIRLPINVREKLYTKLVKLSQDPFNQTNDVKNLVGIEKCYRLRVGNYRIIYKLYNTTLVIEIIKVAHRKEVYQWY